MYACIHASADPALLVACAQAFSPVVEQMAPDIAVLDASGLGRIHGTPHEICAAIAERARMPGFDAQIAIVVSNMEAASARLQKYNVRQISTAAQTLPEWNQNAAGIRAIRAIKLIPQARTVTRSRR